MSLVLNANTLAITPGNSTSFGASGGTEPYVYSLAAGGVGGTINSSTGDYTAPIGLTGIDTVIVTDALLATAQLVMKVCTPLELVCDIIAVEMDLQDDQVYIWDQKFLIPNDSRLYVVVSIAALKAFGVTNQFRGSSGDQINSVNMLARLDINLVSRSTAALLRKEEVLLAFASTYSEQQQELNSFNIARLPTGFLNLSDIEGAAIPYRFTISVNVQYSVTKTTAVPYFDTFEAADVAQIEP